MEHAEAGVIEALIAAERLAPDFGRIVEQIHRQGAARITARQDALNRPLLVGLCGPQGSGKSTAGDRAHRPAHPGEGRDLRRLHVREEASLGQPL